MIALKFQRPRRHFFEGFPVYTNKLHCAGYSDDLLLLMVRLVPVEKEKPDLMDSPFLFSMRLLLRRLNTFRIINLR